MNRYKIIDFDYNVYNNIVRMFVEYRYNGEEPQYYTLTVNAKELNNKEDVKTIVESHIPVSPENTIPSMQTVLPELKGLEWMTEEFRV